MMNGRTTCLTHFENEGSTIGAEAEVNARIAAAIACMALNRTGFAVYTLTFGEIKEALRPVADRGIINGINGRAILNATSYKEIASLTESNDAALHLVLPELASQLENQSITTDAGSAIKSIVDASSRFHTNIFHPQDQYIVGLLQGYGLRIPIHDDWDHSLAYQFLKHLSYDREDIEDDSMIYHYEDMADACAVAKKTPDSFLGFSRISVSAAVARAYPLEAGGVDGAVILDQLADKLDNKLTYPTVVGKHPWNVMRKTLTTMFEGPLRGVPASTTAVLGADALVPDIRSFLTDAIDAEAREGTATTGIPSVSFHSSRFRESMMRVGQSAVVTANTVETTSGPSTLPMAGIGTDNQGVRDMDDMFRMGFAESIPFDAAAVASSWNDSDKGDEMVLATIADALNTSLDNIGESEKENSGRGTLQWRLLAASISGRIGNGLSPERAVLESVAQYLTKTIEIFSHDEDYYYNDDGMVNIPQCMGSVNKAAVDICGVEQGRLTLLTRRGVHSIFLHQAATEVQKELRWSHRSGIVTEDDGTAYLLHVSPKGEYEERVFEKGGFTCTFYEPDGDGSILSRTTQG